MLFRAGMMPENYKKISHFRKFRSSNSQPFYLRQHSYRTVPCLLVTTVFLQWQVDDPTETIKVRILLTGGSGLLGTELLKLEPDLLAPSHGELDITDAAAVAAYVAAHKPDIILHAAAITNNREVEAHPVTAEKVNVDGTANLVQACDGTRIRFVYLSTDYVYKGDRGNYSETDPVHPFNMYATTKLAGEKVVRRVPNHLIIRASFGASEFA